MNGAIYPDHTRSPANTPSLRFNPLEPRIENTLQDYSVLPIRVSHGPPTYGFQVTSPDCRRFFYSGDTGPGFSEGWGVLSRRTCASLRRRTRTGWRPRPVLGTI